MSCLPRRLPALPAAAATVFLAAILAAVLAAPGPLRAQLLTPGQDAPQAGGAPATKSPRTQCWRGWGYLLDSETGGYKSQEMLLVTIGSPLWEAGHPVELFLLDRATGLISEMPSFTVTPENPRLYYRGRLNYVDTTAAIAGSQDRIVIGLSHIEPAKDGVPAKERYNRWACGFPEE